MIGFLFYHGMMPTMQFRSTDEVIQHSKVEINIAMLKKAINGITYDIQPEHFFQIGRAHV
jgi:hypothetical protein